MNCRSAVITLSLAATLLGACAHRPPATADLQGLLPTPLLLLGEQHDAAEHQALQRQTLRQLVDAGQAAALVLEMAERGRRTSGLPRDASEARVREALDWHEAVNAGAWPWATYGPLVMDAVRAGVPVLGGNLPRAQMRTAMAEGGLDATLDAAALQQQRENIRDGHCDLLPATQIAPMARIQIARDRTMAQTATELAAQANAPQMVLLVAGTEHVRRELGVPAHLPAEWRSNTHVVVMHSGLAEATALAGADSVWLTPATPPKDHCAALRQRWGQPGAR